MISSAISVIDPLNHVTVYTYDRNYNLASVVDARNHTTDNDLLERVEDALGRVWSLVYDAGPLSAPSTSTTTAQARTSSPRPMPPAP